MRGMTEYYAYSYHLIWLCILILSPSHAGGDGVLCLFLPFNLSRKLTSPVSGDISIYQDGVPAHNTIPFSHEKSFTLLANQFDFLFVAFKCYLSHQFAISPALFWRDSNYSCASGNGCIGKQHLDSRW